MMSCKHREFIMQGQVLHVGENPNDDVVSGYRAEVRITCATCGVPFEWIGFPGGLLNDGITVSQFGVELRAPVRPMQEVSEKATTVPEVRASYTQSLKLRGLGYTVPCNSWYNVINRELYQSDTPLYKNDDDQLLSAPTLDEIVDWIYSIKPRADVFENRAKIISVMSEIIQVIYTEELESYRVISDASRESGFGPTEKRPFLIRLEGLIDELTEFRKNNRL